MEAADRQKKRILVVEDEGIVAMDLATMLRHMGYDLVGIATSGRDAVRLAGELRPDLVLMDIALRGDMDGIEATEVITAQAPVPVLYLTAHSDRATLDRAKVTAPYGYVLKPFASADLRVAIEITLQRFGADRQLQTVQAELAQSERLAALGRLVAAISHEINNPLQGLLGHVFLAKSRLADHPEIKGVHAYLDAVQVEANHIADIVRRVRDYYAVTADVDLPAQPCEVLCDVMVGTEPTLTEAGITLSMLDAIELPAVAMPPDQLGQVFRALVLNAPRAMPDGGVLTIGRRPSACVEGTLEITFADQGQVLTDENRQRVFEPFATPYPTTDVHGADLGLPIARQIAEAHGGTIEVARGKTGGTVFTVVLPLAETA